MSMLELMLAKWQPIVSGLINDVYDIDPLDTGSFNVTIRGRPLHKKAVLASFFQGKVAHSWAAQTGRFARSHSVKILKRFV